MSAQTDGVNWLSLASVPADTTRTIVAWARVDVDTGTVGLLGITNDFGGQGQIIRSITSDAVNFRHQPGASDLNTTAQPAAGTWYGLCLRYVGESNPGVSADGSLLGWYVEDGNVGSGFDESLGPNNGLSDDSAIGVAIGSGETDSGAVQGTFAIVKIFEGTLTVAQMLTELQYRNPQQTAWASYAFRTGALTTDDSGNARTLTNNDGGGSAVAFVSDEPTDILGDDPAAAGPVAQVVTYAP